MPFEILKMRLNKRQRQPKGQSRIDNPEKVTTLGTQDTVRRQPKQTKNKTHKFKMIGNTNLTRNMYSLS